MQFAADVIVSHLVTGPATPWRSMTSSYPYLVSPRPDPWLPMWVAVADAVSSLPGVRLSRGKPKPAGKISGRASRRSAESPVARLFPSESRAPSPATQASSSSSPSSSSARDPTTPRFLWSLASLSEALGSSSPRDPGAVACVHRVQSMISAAWAEGRREESHPAGRNGGGVLRGGGPPAAGDVVERVAEAVSRDKGWADEIEAAIESAVNASLEETAGKGGSDQDDAVTPVPGRVPDRSHPAAGLGRSRAIAELVSQIRLLTREIERLSAMETLPAEAANYPLSMLATVFFTPELLVDSRTNSHVLSLAGGPLRGSLVVVWARMGGRWMRETARSLRGLLETTHPPPQPHSLPVLGTMALLWAALGSARARAGAGWGGTATPRLAAVHNPSPKRVRASQPVTLASPPSGDRSDGSDAEGESHIQTQRSNDADQKGDENKEKAKGEEEEESNKNNNNNDEDNGLPDDLETDFDDSLSDVALSFMSPLLSDALPYREAVRKWRHSPLSTGRSPVTVLDYPFLLDVVAKTRVLRLLSFIAMVRHVEALAATHRILGESSRLVPLQRSFGGDRVYSRLVLFVSRETVWQDVSAQLVCDRGDLGRPLKVHFRGELGGDYGGVQKEFFQLALRDALGESRGLFLRDPDTGLYWFADCDQRDSQRYDDIKLVGVLLGLALYNGCQVDINFPRAMYRALLGRPPLPSDAYGTHPQLMRNLEKLKEMSDADLDSLELNFFVENESGGGGRELICGGKDVPVTSRNLEVYLRLYALHRTGNAVRMQRRAVYDGFSTAIRVFTDGNHPSARTKTALDALEVGPRELETMLCGVSSVPVDFGDLKTKALYGDGFTATSETVQWFWETVAELPESAHRRLLAFVAGSDRVPVEGLRSVTLAIIPIPGVVDHLPTAQTCFNRLSLPARYSSKRALREKLLIALDFCEGFGFM